LTLLLAILMAVGGLIGGRTGVMIAFAIGLGLNFANYWFSGSLVLKAHGAKVLEPGELQWLQDDIREMTSRVGMPMPKVAFVPKPAPNAFATGRNPDNAVVAVTQGLLDVCDRRQIRAVMAHELGHVRNRDMLTMTLVAGAVSAIAMLAMLARFSAFFGGGDEDGPNPLVLIAVAIFAPMIAMLVQMAISRRREYEADEAGARIAQDPEGLASALEQLHRGIPRTPPISTTGATAHMMIANPFFGRKMSQMFSTHPDPAERIRRLRAMA
jgi:heat shock protein HtpX